MNDTDNRIEALFHRLKRHYADRARLPLLAGMEHQLGCVGPICHCTRDTTIGLGLLQRLYMKVRSEYEE